MKSKLLLLIILLSAFSASANINYIEIHRIPGFEQYVDRFSFLISNQRYYNHWQPEWKFEVSKESLVDELEASFQTFISLPDSNTEVCLLLGDIAHYLYNLDEHSFHQQAVHYYLRAAEQSPDDYRAIWFLGNHYALSGELASSIELYKRSHKQLPENEPAAFWEDYSFASALANMPSTCQYAMDRSKAITGERGYFETQLGESVSGRIIPVSSDSAYRFDNIWTVSGEDTLSFVCRPLGIKVLMDSSWQIQLYDYADKKSAIIFTPPSITSTAGSEITYTIALITRVAEREVKLTEYVDSFIAEYPDRNKYDLTVKYPGILSWEMRKKDMYEELGGAHLHMAGIKRSRPEYPGLLLEEPVTMPLTSNIEYFRATSSPDRFHGDIFYVFILDACEDIYPEALKVFRNLLENQILLE
jgi:tetratricopeptide (TPR) repeat protein